LKTVQTGFPLAKFLNYDNWQKQILFTVCNLGLEIEVDSNSGENILPSIDVISNHFWHLSTAMLGL
jgi:hypothetical protein